MTAPTIPASTAGQQNVSGTGAGTFAPSKPTGTAAGDVLLAIFYREGGVVTMPTGFANYAEVIATANLSPSVYIRMDWKVADGTEGATLTWSWSGAFWRLGSLFCLKGTAASNMLERLNSASNNGAATANDPPLIALGGNVTADDLVFLIGANSAAGSGNWSQPASWTLRLNSSGDDLGIGSIVQTSGGSPGSVQMLWGGNELGTVVSVIFGVKGTAGVTTVTETATPVTLALQGTRTRTGTPVTVALQRLDIPRTAAPITFSLAATRTETGTPVTLALQATGTQTATPVTLALQQLGIARSATPLTAALQATRTQMATPVAMVLQATRTQSATPLTAALQATKIQAATPVALALQQLSIPRTATPLTLPLQTTAAEVATPVSLTLTHEAIQTATPISISLTNPNGQFLRPMMDVDVGDWTTDAGASSNLYARLNEPEPDDASYVQSPPGPSVSTLPYIVRLGTAAAPLPGDGILRIRDFDDQAGGSLDYTFDLMQGATVLQTFGPFARSDGVPLQVDLTVIAANVTDWTIPFDLRISAVQE